MRTIWSYARNLFRAWTPEHAVFEAATASLFAVLLKAITKTSTAAAIFVGLAAFVAIASAFSVFRIRPERSFESLCDDLIADARFIDESGDARQWATKVWIALKATPIHIESSRMGHTNMTALTCIRTIGLSPAALV